VYTSSILVVASTGDIKCLTIVELPRQDWSREAMRARRLDHVLLAMPAGRATRENSTRTFSESRRRHDHRISPRAAAAGLRKAHPALLVNDLAGLTAALTDAGSAIAHDQPLEGYDRIFVDAPRQPDRVDRGQVFLSLIIDLR
jgi:hypothetical protein